MGAELSFHLCWFEFSSFRVFTSGSKMELYPAFLLLLLSCFAQVTLCRGFDKDNALNGQKHPGLKKDNGKVSGPKQGQDFSAQISMNFCDPDITDAQAQTGYNCPCLAKCDSKNLKGLRMKKCEKKCFKKCAAEEK